jgi:RES domain-containing protein
MDLVAYRWSDYDRPFRANLHTGDGRYHRPGSEPIQYWSLHPLGPWAEYIRANFLEAPETLDEVHQRIWAARFSFEESELLRVTYDWARSSHQVAPEDLVAEDFSGCQMFADWARGEFAALLVPSAALPGTQNLVVFGPRAASPYQLDPVDLTLDVPTSVVADNAQPHPHLGRFVRFRDEVHPELAAWLDGRAYVPPAQIGVPPAWPRF